jgi:hypothetical protein
VPRQKLLMQNVASGEQQECRVIHVEKDPTGPTRVAVEFTRPAPRFPALCRAQSQDSCGLAQENILALSRCRVWTGPERADAQS